MATTTTSYPIDVTYAQGPLNRSRLTVFFRSLIAIPIAIVAYVYSLVFSVTTFCAWVAILFTGRYPASLYSFAVNVMRIQTNLIGYMHFITDDYPPFSGGDAKAAAYPIQFSATYSGSSSRVTVFFRLILAIPIMIFGMLVGIASYLAALVAWVAIIITGRYPAGLLNFVQGTTRSLIRINSYLYYLTDEYPPFSLS